MPLRWQLQPSGFALNILLSAVIESALELFGWSLGMGALYLAGFFGYLGDRDRSPP
jgi:hypothetical protein